MWDIIDMGNKEKINLGTECAVELADGTFEPDYAFVVRLHLENGDDKIAIGRGEEWDMELTFEEARDFAARILQVMNEWESVVIAS